MIVVAFGTLIDVGPKIDTATSTVVLEGRCSLALAIDLAADQASSETSGTRRVQASRSRRIGSDNGREAAEPVDFLASPCGRPAFLPRWSGGPLRRETRPTPRPIGGQPHPCRFRGPPLDLERLEQWVPAATATQGRAVELAP